MDRGFKRLIAAVIAWKLALLGLVAALPRLWPGGFDAGNFQANFHWPPDAAPAFSSLFSTWDGQHFLYLAREGYRPGAPSNNFYPLWPWLISAAGGGLAAALLLANLLSLAALAVLYAWLREEKGEPAARWSLLFLIAYPGAFFLCLPFSESLFLLLAVGLFACLSRRRFALAAAAAFLLPLSRPQGILVALPYWYALRGKGKTKLEDAALWLAPLVGVCAYLLFMLHATGDAFEGFKAYRALFPGEPSVSKLLDVPAFLKAFVHVTSWHGTTGSLMERLWFVLFLACLPALWKRDKLLFLYALPMGLVPAVTLSFVSYTRHLLLVFPVFIVLADFFEKRPPALRWTVLAAAAAFQFFLLALHANNHWVA